MTGVPPLAGRVGIFQGRLVPSTNGELQCHPGDRWAEELRLAGELGLAHVELLATRVPDRANPVWSVEGRAALRATAADAGVGLVSLCTEEPLEVALADARVADDVARRLGAVAADLDLSVTVVPLYEASDPTAGDAAAIARGVRRIAEELAPHDTRVVLELPMDADAVERFLADVGAETVGVCYDLGNATAAGHVPASELRRLAPRLWHVHAKDKDMDGTNVRFGTGAVDFAAALTTLADIGYRGRITMEATRGDDPVATAAAHRDFLLRLG